MHPRTAPASSASPAEEGPRSKARDDDDAVFARFAVEAVAIERAVRRALGLVSVGAERTH